MKSFNEWLEELGGINEAGTYDVAPQLDVNFINKKLEEFDNNFDYNQVENLAKHCWEVYKSKDQLRDEHADYYEDFSGMIYDLASTIKQAQKELGDIYEAFEKIKNIPFGEK